MSVSARAVSSIGTMPVQVVFRNPLAEIADAPRLAVALRPVCISPLSHTVLSCRRGIGSNASCSASSRPAIQTMYVPRGLLSSEMQARRQIFSRAEQGG